MSEQTERATMTIDEAARKTALRPSDVRALVRRGVIRPGPDEGTVDAGDVLVYAGARAERIRRRLERMRKG